MRLDLLIAYLETEGLGTAGETIFAHRMPSDVSVGLMVRMPLQGVPVSAYLPNYYKTEMFQIVVRSPDQKTGDDLAARTARALTLQNKDFIDPVAGRSVMQIKVMWPKNLPIVYPRTNGEELEWSVDFCLAYTWDGTAPV